MDWLKKLLEGDPNTVTPEPVRKLADTIPVSGDREMMTEPAPVMKSDLLGNILAGIPGVSGFPMTKPAEDALVKSRMEEEKSLTPPEPTPEAKRAPATSRKTIQPKVDTPAVPPEVPLNPRQAMEKMASMDPVVPESQGESPAPQASAKTIETPDPDKELRDAQQARRDELNRLMMADGITQILYGLTKSSQPYDPNIFANARKMADLGVEDLKERQAATRQRKLDSREDEKFNMDKEKDMLAIDKLKSSLEDEKQRRDPNSLASQAVREFQKQRFESLSQATNGKIKFDPKAFDSMSAEQLEQTFGKFSPENIATSIMSNDRLREEAKLRSEERAQAKKDKEELRETQNSDKRRKELDSYIQKSQKDLDKQVGTIQKGRVDLAMVESALKNPSAVKDTGALYSLVKGFDPESAVREGELVLANKGQSYMDQVKTAFSRLKANDARVLQQGYLKQILDYTREVQQLREQQYRQKMDKRLKYAEERLGMQPEEREFIDPLFEEAQEKIAREPQQETFSPSEEAGIQAVIAKNPGATRQQVIDALRSQGKIK